MFSNHRRLGFEMLESRRMLAAVDIPDDLTGQPTEQVLTPVNIDDASGVRGAEIRVSYDATVLDINQANVLAGSVWSNHADTEVVANVDQQAGSIVVFVFSAEGLGALSGSLLEMQFTIRGDVSVGSSTVVDLTKVRLNEGQISVDPAPQLGPDSTDGLITVVGEELPGAASVSGFVYADTNNNNRPDPFEGLARVTITLVNVATGEQTQTTTQSDGKYEFRDLASGSYLVQERQPAAYLDGGPNEISIELAGGQSLTDQNFRERGLRPEFVYNRLFTTVVMPINSPGWVAAIEQINTDAEQGAAGGQTISTQVAATPLSQEPAGNAASAEGGAAELVRAMVTERATLAQQVAVAGDAGEGEAATPTIVGCQPEITGEGAVASLLNPASAVVAINTDNAPGGSGASYETSFRQANESKALPGAVSTETGAEPVAHLDDDETDARQLAGSTLLPVSGWAELELVDRTFEVVDHWLFDPPVIST